MPTFSADALVSMTGAILESVGTPISIARRVATVLINANLTGHDSHGIIRLPGYLEQVDQKQIEAGNEPRIVRETPATAVLDGRKGWGHYTLDRAMDLAIAKSRAVGIGAVAVFRCNHAGRMGEYVEAAARSGCIGMIFAGLGGRETGCASPLGGRGRYLGTNPIAFGVPSDSEAAFILDFATTAVAQGKIKVAQSKGEALPPGWILDSNGLASIRPEDFLNGGSLLHFGGHKGYALSLATCILGGLSGAFLAERSRMGGIFVQAIDVQAFMSLDIYRRNVLQFLGEIKTAPRASEGQEVLVPGEPENRNRQHRMRHGIELPETVWRQIQQVAKNRKISLPESVHIRPDKLS